MLLQMDASRHDWLEGRGPYLSLVGAIDDATGKVPWACFREQEDAYGYFTVMRETVSRFGIPVAAYADRHSIFYQGREVQLRKLSLEEQLAAQREPTQFGRLLNELGVQLIHALSPQAKGRVERLWGTFQDRLASELRLAGARNCEHADQVLRRFLTRHNRRFVVSAQEAQTAWVEWPKERSLDEYFCFKYRRVVLNDNTVRIGTNVIDIPPTANRRASYAHARVEVQERFNGTFAVYSTVTASPRKFWPSLPLPTARAAGRQSFLQSHQLPSPSHLRPRPVDHGSRRRIIPGDVQRLLKPWPKRKQHERTKNRRPRKPQDSRFGVASTPNPQRGSSFDDGNQRAGVAFRLWRRNRSTSTLPYR